MFTSFKRSYKLVLLYNCDIELGEFQLFGLKFFQFLYKHGAKNITIQLIGEGKLAYPIKRQDTAQFVEILLSISPKGITKFHEMLKIDQNVLRFHIVKKIDIIDQLP